MQASEVGPIQDHDDRCRATFGEAGAERESLAVISGLVQATERFKAAENGGATRYEDQYMRMVMFFDTGAAKYVWLTESLFIAEGRIAGKNEIEYQIYRVT